MPFCLLLLINLCLGNEIGLVNPPSTWKYPCGAFTWNYFQENYLISSDSTIAKVEISDVGKGSANPAASECIFKIKDFTPQVGFFQVRQGSWSYFIQFTQREDKSYQLWIQDVSREEDFEIRNISKTLRARPIVDPNTRAVMASSFFTTAFPQYVRIRYSEPPMKKAFALK